MEVKFLRDISKNYMVIYDIDDFKNNYKINMLQDNIIEGILKFKLKTFDSKEKYYYSISSMQSLKVFYERNYISLQDLRSMFSALEFCIKELDKYLLDFNDIVLDPKMTFINIREGKFSFCYYPNYEGDFKSEILVLLNYILSRTDHSNLELLNIVYEMQQLAMNDEYVFNDLLKILDQDKEEKEEILSEEKDISYEVPYINKKIEIKDEQIKKVTLALFIIGGIIWIYIISQFKDPTYKYYIIGIFLIIIIYIVYNRFFRNKKTLEYIEPDAEKEEYKICDEEEMTVFLGENEKRGFRYLKSFEDQNQDIEIEKFPAIIGKMEEKVDFTIANNKVSRIHAKIIFADDKYYIEDLNSTNGTYINETRLIPYEKNILKIGDIIKISELNFKFV